jgi:hypothetical protein
MQCGPYLSKKWEPQSFAKLLGRFGARGSWQADLVFQVIL